MRHQPAGVFPIVFISEKLFRPLEWFTFATTKNSGRSELNWNRFALPHPLSLSLFFSIVARGSRLFNFRACQSSFVDLNNLLFGRWSPPREFALTGGQINTQPCLISHPQGNPLYHNAATGTIISNQSLVLQSVTRSRAGIYTCIGNNQEGDGESNPLNLDIKCEYPLHTFPACHPP